MPSLAVLLDLMALIAALAAAWLWFRASLNVVSRVSREEALDHADYNRLVIAMNRSQLLNRRAALATAASALAIALKYAHGLLAG